MTTETDTKQDALRSLYDMGILTDRQIVICACVALGFSPQKAEEIANGLTKTKAAPTPRHRWTEDERQTLQSLYAAGASRKEIAKALGVPVKSVYSAIANLRLRRPAKG